MKRLAERVWDALRSGAVSAADWFKERFQRASAKVVAGWRGLASAVTTIASATRRPIVTWRSGSLARGSRFAKAQLDTTPRRRRIWDRTRRDAFDFIRDEFSFVLLLIVAFGPPFLPVPWGFRPLRQPDAATSLLQALWQVQGATLAITLAVVIFVFQAVYGSRRGGSLRQFAEDTGLFFIFYVGVLGLGLDGLVLLGGGFGGASWPATWATIWAAFNGALLIVLFVLTIRAIEPEALHKRRLRRARREIQDETERQIFQRIAGNALQTFCTANAVEFTAFYGGAPSGTATPIFGRNGEITDIRLRPLTKIAAAASRLGLPQPRLRAYLGSAVSESTELMWAEPAALAVLRRPRRVFRVSRGQREQAFRETVKRLHDEAVAAIASPAPGAYKEITEIYEDMLLAPAETWRRYGQPYGVGALGRVSMFELTFLDIIERDLYDELSAAVTGSNREIALEAMRFPLRVASRAVSLGATGITARMNALQVNVVIARMRAP